MRISLKELEELSLQVNNVFFHTIGKHAKDVIASEIMPLLYIAAKYGCIDFFESLIISRKNYLFNRKFMSAFIDKISEEDALKFYEQNELMAISDPNLQDCILQLRWKVYLFQNKDN